MINTVQILVLVAAFALAALGGHYFIRFVGWWAMIPAVLTGLLLLFVAGAGVVRPFLNHRQGTGSGNEKKPVL
jgi:hypothetical protein